MPTGNHAAYGDDEHNYGSPWAANTYGEEQAYGNEQCVVTVPGTAISTGTLKCGITAQISCEGKRTSTGQKLNNPCFSKSKMHHHI
jgi:hypothetical protein